MKKINMSHLDADFYQETLENGLEIYMIPYENKKNYFISYATKYGSDIISFTDKNQITYKPPLGIAHFLEHKMFEEESGEDPFTFFSKSGTDSNASTSFDSTQYICYGTKEFEKNLAYLLKFVSNPYYTDENVEKEKGIIAEEINMYQDMPDFKLDMKIREGIFVNHPRKIDIAGTVEEINKITKEDLYTCYNNFYIPNNMFILIVGNFDKDLAIEIIKNEIGYINRKELPVINKVEESLKVNEKDITIHANIEIPKIAVGLKIPKDIFIEKDLEVDLYLEMLTTILFGSSSYFREYVRNEKLLNSIYTEWESVDNYKIFYLTATTEKKEKLIEEIKNTFKNIHINEKTMNRIKKVWIANEVRMIDSVTSTVNNCFDDIIKYGKIIPNRIDIIKNMKLKTLKEIIDKIDFDNISIVKMIPEK